MNIASQERIGLAGLFTRRELPGWAISLGLHLGILLLLLAVKITAQSVANVALLESTIEEVQDPNDFEASQADQQGTGADVTALSTTVAPGSGGGNDGGATISASEAIEQRVNENLVGNVGQSIRIVDDVSLPQMTELTDALSGPGKGGNHVQITGSSTENLDGQGQGGVGPAMDRLTWEIRQSLREKKTTVVWLFDQSLSLQDRRDAITERFEMVYRQLESLEEGGKGALLTMAATYGQDFKFLTEKPTEDVQSLIPKVRDIPNDPSGKENVFSAVSQVVNRVKRDKDKNRSVLVFIITDEKGDDAEAMLDDTITLCRRQGVRVYTVGNAAPFGREKGFATWKYADGTSEDLEVDAGPETVEPEALALGFFGGRGPDLSRMSSGYGPYALTRLCKETGGQYLIAQEDHKGERFDPAIMRNYQPDYRPIREYMKGVEKNKAKSSLISAAKATKLDNIPMPRLEFPAYNDTVARETMNEAQKPAAEMDYKINRLIDLLAQGEKDREKLTEPRWRAAYDLAAGRALAMRVRIFGYNNMLAEMRSTPKPFKNKESNVWRIEPSKEINAGQAIKKAEKQAMTYLKRVVDEHPNTPWARLAERELSTPMGWQWKEVNDPQTFAANTTQDQARRQIQLAEEMRAAEAAKRPMTPPRERPKL